MKRQYDFSKARRGPVVPQTPGKTRITIRLDNDVIEHFQAIVDRAGSANYQSLINDALREHLRGARLERLRTTAARRRAGAQDFLVGAAGFEPATTRTPSVCATRLRYAPTPQAAPRRARMRRPASLPQELPAPPKNARRDRAATAGAVGWRQPPPATAGGQSRCRPATNPSVALRRRLAVAARLFRGGARAPLHKRAQVDRKRPGARRLPDKVHDFVAYRGGRHEM